MATITSPTSHSYRYVIAACAFVTTLIVGEAYYSLSVLAPSMAEEMKWSATQVGAAFTIFMLVSGVCSPLAGAFIYRFGARLAVVSGTVLMVGALVGMSQVGAIWGFYGSAALLGIGTALGGILAAQQLVGDWFVEQRSLVLGIVLAGSGLGGLVFAPLVGNLIVAWDSWRSVWLFLAALALLPVFLGALMVRNRPVQTPAQENGLDDTPADATNETLPVVRPVEWETPAAIRTRAFWLLAFAYGTMMWAVQGVTSHQVAYLNGEVHIELARAAAVLGLLSGCSIVGRILAGWLAGRFEPRLVMGVALLSITAGLLVLLACSSLTALYLYVVLFGIGYGGMAPLPSAAALDYFGPRNFASIMGIMMPLATFMGMLSPLMAGAIKDATGSYNPAFLILTAVVIVGAVCAFLARQPEPQATEIPEPSTLEPAN